jgi:hypothetical protein
MINFDRMFGPGRVNLSKSPPRLRLQPVTESFALPPDPGSGIMSEYRVYIIGSDGHFKASVPLDCASDEAAKQHARQLVDGHDVELWQGVRKVATFEHMLINAGKD